MSNLKHSPNSFNYYFDEPFKKLREQYGAFFAVNDKQLEEQAKKDVEYVSMGMHLICPKNSAKDFKKEVDELIKKASQDRLKALGKEKLIRYELNNHEVQYSRDFTTVYEILSPLGITEQEIKTVFSGRKLPEEKQKDAKI